MTPMMALFDLRETVARLEEGGRTIDVAGQQIACATLFETQRSQAAVFRLLEGQRIPAHTHSAIDDIFFGVRGWGRIRTWDEHGAARDKAVGPGMYDSHHFALPRAPS